MCIVQSNISKTNINWKKFPLFWRTTCLISFTLNQINHWIKTQYKKQIKQKIFFEIFISFFAIASNASPLSYAIQIEKEAQAVLSKKSVYSREVLEEIKNHYIKEEDACKHFFVETNKNYFEEEITWIRTLVPLSTI